MHPQNGFQTLPGIHFRERVRLGQIGKFRECENRSGCRVGEPERLRKVGDRAEVPHVRRVGIVQKSEMPRRRYFLFRRRFSEEPPSDGGEKAEHDKILSDIKKFLKGESRGRYDRQRMALPREFMNPFPLVTSPGYEVHRSEHRERFRACARKRRSKSSRWSLRQLMKFGRANIVSGFVPVRGSAVRPPRLAAQKLFNVLIFCFIASLRYSHLRHV